MRACRQNGVRIVGEGTKSTIVDNEIAECNWANVFVGACLEKTLLTEYPHA